MAHPSNGTISMSFYGAASRTKSVLQKLSPPDIIGVHCPQRQALSRLTWRATQEELAVPYRFLDSAVLLDLPGTWALFQLLEAIQLRAAWMRDEMPGVEDHHISDAFAAVAHPDRKTPFFPDGNVSPQVRRALFQTGPFRPHIDWAVYLERADDGNFANLTRSRTEPFRITLPDNVWLNPETDVWEVAP